MRPLVVIPTYDEADNIVEVVERVIAAVPDVHVLVVDDASPDGTGRIAEDLGRSRAGVHVLHRAEKNGLGAAYRSGFAWALAHDYDAVVQMDADLSHPPERLPVMLSALAHADVVLGSRYVAGGATEGWPWRRLAVSRLGNAYVSTVLQLGVRDATAGFRAYRREVLARCGLADIRSNGYCFQVEMTERVRQAGFRVAEVPITFVERVAGRSKMSTRIVVEALWRVAGWGLRDATLGRRLRPRHDRMSYDLPVDRITVDLTVISDRRRAAAR